MMIFFESWTVAYLIAVTSDNTRVKMAAFFDVEEAYRIEYYESIATMYNARSFCRFLEAMMVPLMLYLCKNVEMDEFNKIEFLNNWRESVKPPKPTAEQRRDARRAAREERRAKATAEREAARKNNGEQPIEEQNA